VKSWRVNEIEAPGGRIDPAVLTTDDGARAIAIRLDPGQELRDHQVRERVPLATADGARILLILAPWPGPGHYPEGGPSA